MPEEPTESPPLPTASVTDVANFISNRGFKELAQLLVDDEVDGEALYLLSVADFLDYGLKKGPAMKLHNLLQQRKPSGAQDAPVRVEVPASPKPSSMHGMAEDEVDECRGRQVDRASAAAKASRKPGRLRSYAAKETAQVLFNADATEAQQVDGDSVVPKRSQKSGRVRSAPAKEVACAQEDEEMEEEKEEEPAPPPPKPGAKSPAAKGSAKSAAAAKSSAKEEEKEEEPAPPTPKPAAKSSAAKASAKSSAAAKSSAKDSSRGNPDAVADEQPAGSAEATSAPAPTEVDASTAPKRQRKASPAKMASAKEEKATADETVTTASAAEAEAGKRQRKSSPAKVAATKEEQVPADVPATPDSTGEAEVQQVLSAESKVLDMRKRLAELGKAVYGSKEELWQRLLQAEAQARETLAEEARAREAAAKEAQTKEAQARAAQLKEAEEEKKKDKKGKREKQAKNEEKDDNKEEEEEEEEKEEEEPAPPLKPAAKSSAAAKATAKSSAATKSSAAKELKKKEPVRKTAKAAEPQESADVPTPEEPKKKEKKDKAAKVVEAPESVDVDMAQPPLVTEEPQDDDEVKVVTSGKKKSKDKAKAVQEDVEMKEVGAEEPKVQEAVDEAEMGPPGADALQPGTRVKLGGLTKATSLNGRLATCVSFNEQTGRWSVQVDNQEEHKTVLPRYLQVVADSTSAAKRRRKSSPAKTAAAKDATCNREGLANADDAGESSKASEGGTSGKAVAEPKSGKTTKQEDEDEEEEEKEEEPAPPPPKPGAKSPAAKGSAKSAAAAKSSAKEEEKEEEPAPPTPKPAAKSSAAKASAKSSAAAKSSAKGSAASSSEPPKKAAEADDGSAPVKAVSEPKSGKTSKQAKKQTSEAAGAAQQESVAAAASQDQVVDSSSVPKPRGTPSPAKKIATPEEAGSGPENSDVADAAEQKSAAAASATDPAIAGAPAEDAGYKKNAGKTKAKKGLSLVAAVKDSVKRTHIKNKKKSTQSDGNVKKFGSHKFRRLLKKPDAAREMAKTPSESAREEDTPERAEAASNPEAQRRKAAHSESVRRKGLGWPGFKYATEKLRAEAGHWYRPEIKKKRMRELIEEYKGLPAEEKERYARKYYESQVSNRTKKEQINVEEHASQANLWTAFSRSAATKTTTIDLEEKTATATTGNEVSSIKEQEGSLAGDVVDVAMDAADMASGTSTAEVAENSTEDAAKEPIKQATKRSLADGSAKKKRKLRKQDVVVKADEPANGGEASAPEAADTGKEQPSRSFWVAAFTRNAAPPAPATVEDPEQANVSAAAIDVATDAEAGNVAMGTLDGESSASAAVGISGDAGTKRKRSVAAMLRQLQPAPKLEGDTEGASIENNDNAAEAKDKNDEHLELMCSRLAALEANDMLQAVVTPQAACCRLLTRSPANQGLDSEGGSSTEAAAAKASLSIHQRAELFSIDEEVLPLMVQENYLQACTEARKEKKEGEEAKEEGKDEDQGKEEDHSSDLLSCAAAADAMAWGDVLSCVSLASGGDCDLFAASLLLAAVVPSAQASGKLDRARPPATSSVHWTHRASIGELSRLHGFPKIYVSGEFLKWRSTATAKTRDDPRRAQRAFRAHLQRAVKSVCAAPGQIEEVDEVEEDDDDMEEDKDVTASNGTAGEPVATPVRKRRREGSAEDTAAGITSAEKSTEKPQGRADEEPEKPAGAQALADSTEESADKPHKHGDEEHEDLAGVQSLADSTEKGTEKPQGHADEEALADSIEKNTDKPHEHADEELEDLAPAQALAEKTTDEPHEHAVENCKDLAVAQTLADSAENSTERLQGHAEEEGEKPAGGPVLADSMEKNTDKPHGHGDEEPEDLEGEQAPADPAEKITEEPQGHADEEPEDLAPAQTPADPVEKLTEEPHGHADEEPEDLAPAQTPANPVEKLTEEPQGHSEEEPVKLAGAQALALADTREEAQGYFLPSDLIGAGGHTEHQAPPRQVAAQEAASDITIAERNNEKLQENTDEAPAD